MRRPVDSVIPLIKIEHIPKLLPYSCPPEGEKDKYLYRVFVESMVEYVHRWSKSQPEEDDQGVVYCQAGQLKSLKDAITRQFNWPLELLVQTRGL